MTRIGLDFCCNDPDNGLFAGRVEGIQLYDTDPVFELEPRREPAPKFTRLEESAIRISGKRWPILGEKEWFGNWCWNQYVFDVEVAADLLIWLNQRGLFTLSCGDERLFNAWRWGPGRFATFRPLLVALLAEAAR